MLSEAREHVEMARFLAAPLLDGRLGGTLAVVRAEIAMAEGHGERARAAIDEGIRMVSTTGDDEVLGQLGLLGLRIVRERNQHLDRRTSAGAKQQLDEQRAHYEQVVEAAVAGRPTVGATTALLDRAGRRAGPSGPDCVAGGGNRWYDVVWPRLAVRARLSAAVAFFEVGDRAECRRRAWTTVAAMAAGIGNRTLAEEAERIARRAGLRVAATVGRRPRAQPGLQSG